MVILLKSDKSLIISKPSRIRQKEKLVDKLIFYIPQTYENIDLTDFVVTFYYYIDPINEAKMEILTQIESDKDGFSKYTVGVDSDVTNAAGILTGSLTLTKTDQDEGKQYVLKSGEVSFEILTFEDYYKFVTDESLAPIDNKMLELDNKIQELNALAVELGEKQVDDLALSDDGLLQLTADGNTVGNGVVIEQPPEEPDIDDDDGIIDIINL